MQFARHNLALLRQEIEDSVSAKAPGALSPRLRTVSERVESGVRGLDDALGGGMPVGAITELVGPECSGRTTAAINYAASLLKGGSVAAWVDVEDMFDPISAAMSGVDLRSMLWIRCGSGNSQTNDSEPAPVSGSSAISPDHALIPKSAGGPHPRSEGRGMSSAIQQLLVVQPRSRALPPRKRDRAIGTPGAPNYSLASFATDRQEQIASDRQPSRRQERVLQSNAAPRCAEPQAAGNSNRPPAGTPYTFHPQARATAALTRRKQKRTWTPLDQALRATDLLLQAGGFGLIVLDLGSTPADMSWRIPLATWFRYRAACERARTSLLLLSRHACARSSAELVVRMQAGRMQAEGNVLTGIDYRAAVERQRFQPQQSNVVPIRKPPQSQSPGTWQGPMAWAI